MFSFHVGGSAQIEQIDCLIVTAPPAQIENTSQFCVKVGWPNFCHSESLQPEFLLFCHDQVNHWISNGSRSCTKQRSYLGKAPATFLSFCKQNAMLNARTQILRLFCVLPQNPILLKKYVFHGKRKTVLQPGCRICSELKVSQTSEGQF